MRLYVESNFILEIALRQQGVAACQAILDMAGEGRVELVLPTFGLAEPFETLGRRAREREEMKTRLDRDLALLERSEHYSAQARQSRSAVLLLSVAARQELESLLEVLEKVLRIATIIPASVDIVKEAREAVRKFDMKSQDAIIYASILIDLASRPVRAACFVTTNKKDFNDPDILHSLESINCKVLFAFENAMGYVKSA